MKRNGFELNGTGPTQKALAEERTKWQEANIHNMNESRHPNVSNCYMSRTVVPGV